MNRRAYLAIGLTIVVIVVAGSAVILMRTISKTSTGTAAVTSTSTTNTISTNGTSTPPTRPRTNSYAINLPNSLMLVDSQGRRTGEDPITDITYHEIPNTEYFEEGDSGQLYVTSPANEKYTLYVLGGATGEYHLDSWVDAGGGTPTPVPQRIAGNITKGSMISYAQNYNTSNIASSSLVLSDTFTSTISITSSPPNNLPPPPIP